MRGFVHFCINEFFTNFGMKRVKPFKNKGIICASGIGSRVSGT